MTPEEIKAAAQAQRDQEEGRLIRNAVQGFDPNHPDADSRLADVIAAAVQLGRLAEGKRDCVHMSPLESARQSLKFILEQVAVIERELPPEDPKPELEGARISRNPRFNGLWEGLQRCMTALLTCAYEETTPTVRVSYRAHAQNAQHLIRALEQLSAAIR